MAAVFTDGKTWPTEWHELLKKNQIDSLGFLLIKIIESISSGVSPTTKAGIK